MIEQAISILGALLILMAYAAHQWNKMQSNSILYLSLNLIGSVILTVAAIRVSQMGLTVMEGAWALISLAGLFRLKRPSQNT